MHPSAGGAGHAAPTNSFVIMLTTRPRTLLQEVLDMLRPLSADAFVVMLTNFYRGLKGKFKVPTFAHQELDLYTVSRADCVLGALECACTG